MSFSRLRQDLSREDQAFLRVYKIVVDSESSSIDETGAVGTSGQVSFRTEMLANAFMAHGGGALVDAMEDTVSTFLYSYCEEYGYEPVILKNNHFMKRLTNTVKDAFYSGGFNRLDLTVQQFDQMTDYWSKYSQEQIRGLMSEEQRRENRRKKKVKVKIK